MTQTQKRAQEKTENPEKKSRRFMTALQKTGWGKTVLLVICLLFLCLSACLSGCRQADPDGKGGNPDSAQGTESGESAGENLSGETALDEIPPETNSGESGQLPPAADSGDEKELPSETNLEPGDSSLEEPALSIKEWLRMEEGDEPRTAWIVAFDALNVRRFCYSRGTVVGQFAAGQQVLVTGPARYGFYPVAGTDKETGVEIRGYCSEDYVSFLEYTGPAVRLDIGRYVQTDERWGELMLGESRFNIAQAGCTTTCFAMCESYLTGTEITPDQMWAELTYSNEGNLYWPETYFQDYSPDYLIRIYQKLHQGIPVLIGSRQGSGQHWVLVTGYDPGEKEITSSSQLKSSDFIINDPASKGRATLAEFFRDLPHFIKFAYYTGE